MSFLSQPISLIPTQPKRTIDKINIQVIINESTTDNLTITKQPVQEGASITDHSYMEPTAFSSTAYFQDNSNNSLTSPSTGLSKIYKSLLDLQSSRSTFDIVTPKRVYKSMLMSSLTMTTDKNTENILAISMAFQQVIIVSVTTANIPRSRQKFPSTAATQPAGPKQSSLYTLSTVPAALAGAP